MTQPITHRMTDDIQAQPAVLRAALDSMQQQVAALAPYAARLREGAFSDVILTGMGGSFGVLFPALLTLIGRGVRATAVETSELLLDYAPLLTPTTLVIAISQSGRSAETVRLLERRDQVGAILGVTNTLGSPLAEQATETLFIEAGAENAVSTKTYTCTLAALHLLAAALTDPDALTGAAAAVRHTVNEIDTMLPAWDEVAQRMVAHLDPPRFLVFLGRGAARASALAGALVVKETAKVPTEGMLGGQFRHGPLEVLAPGVGVVIFTGQGRARELNLALAADLIGRGGRVVCVGDAVPGALHVPVSAAEERLLPLAEIVPIQWFAACLAMARGIEPGAFVHSAKVTTTE
jgi:glucosamine--fructose-6-phosphate aminotransferase (isomerizing)